MNFIEYGRENSGVIMLLHGGGLSWWNYGKEAELLGEHYHVILPVLDGHAGSDADFLGIEENAEKIISYIDSEFGGAVFMMGGLSLGAQILTEILSCRSDICRYAVVESASVIPSKATHALIGPAFSSSYGLIRKKRFAKMQFRALHIREDLFDDYYRDTSEISKENMIAFLKANTAYEAKPDLRKSGASVRIIAGGKEKKRMLRSAKLLSDILPMSRLEIKKGLYHGEYSINYPELYVKELLDMTGQEGRL